MGPMNCRRVTFSWMAGLVLVACTPATTGLGGSGAADDSDSETDAETDAETDNGESGEAEAETDAPGDGDPTDDESESPTDGDSCGDGILDPGEECDGSDLDSMDCVALGFLKGELTCGATCSFDTAGCLDAVCGDGIIEGSEECDGMDLGGVDCVALGFGIGKPICTNACLFDTSVCPSPGEGENCSVVNWCPNNLNCIGGKCYDGSLGDPCYTGWDCQDGLSCKGDFPNGTCQP